MLITNLHKLKNSVQKTDFLEYKNYIFNMPETLEQSRNFQSQTKEILFELKGIYKNSSTNYKAAITSETIGKALRPSPRVDQVSERYFLNLFLARHLNKLFEKAIYVDTLQPMKQKRYNVNEMGYHHFISPIAINGLHYRVIITAREKINSDILYVVAVEAILLYKTLDEDTFLNYEGLYRIGVKSLMQGIKIWNYDLSTYAIYDIDDFICDNQCCYYSSNIFIFH